MDAAFTFYIYYKQICTLLPTGIECKFVSHICSLPICPQQNTNNMVSLELCPSVCLSVNLLSNYFNSFSLVPLRLATPTQVWLVNKRKSDNGIFLILCICEVRRKEQSGKRWYSYYKSYLLICQFISCTT